MAEPLKCIECGVELTTADAEDAVKTDAGPCHRECFQGPVQPPDIADDVLGDAVSLEEEEAARCDHNDVPLPVEPPHLKHLADLGLYPDDYDKADIDMRRMEREDLDTPLDPDH